MRHTPSWTGLEEAPAPVSETQVKPGEQLGKLLAAYHRLYEVIWNETATLEGDTPGYNLISYADTNAIDEAGAAVEALLAVTEREKRYRGAQVIDNISGMRGYRVRVESDGSIGLLLRQKYADMIYLLDLSQAEELGRALVEISAGVSVPGQTDTA
jgi:hypothetical protein